MSPPHAEIQEDSELHTNRDVFLEVEGRRTDSWSEGCSQIWANISETRFDAEYFIVTCARLNWNMIWCWHGGADVPFTPVTNWSRDAWWSAADVCNVTLICNRQVMHRWSVSHTGSLLKVKVSCSSTVWIIFTYSCQMFLLYVQCSCRVLVHQCHYQMSHDAHIQYRASGVRCHVMRFDCQRWKSFQCHVAPLH